MEISSYRTMGAVFLLTLCCHSQDVGLKKYEAKMPFQLASGFLIEFQGDLGPLKGLKFILDTGATHSVLDHKLARKLGAHLHPTKVFAFDKRLRVEEAVFPDISFGSLHFTDVSLLVGNLAEFSSLAIGADAIIGSDLLSRTNFTIDYDERTLIFRSLESPLSSGDRQTMGLVLQLQLQGHPIELLLDTGIERIVLFEDRLHKQIPDLLIQDQVRGFTVGRWSHATLASLPAMYLGAKAVEGRVYLLPGPQANVIPGVAGYLGTSSLKPHRIECDIANHCFRWR